MIRRSNTDSISMVPASHSEAHRCRDVVDTLRLTNATVPWHLRVDTRDLAVARKWNGSAPVRGLRCPGVNARDHSDDASVEEDVGNPLESQRDVEQDLVVRLVDRGAVLVRLGGVTGGKRHPDLPAGQP